jgi:hypothetical protein
MIIVAGDSFVYGSELQSSANTFAELLAPGCTNIAWPGFGNDSIARTTITRCEQDVVDGVLVSWTFPGRYEFRFAYDTLQKTGNWHTVTPWTNESSIKIQQEFVTKDKNTLIDHILSVNRAKNTGVAEFAETFYKHVGGTEYWEIYSSLKEVVYLQNYLRIKNIPYMFTCADNSLRYNFTTRSNDATINSLLNQIDFAKWFWFPEGTNPQDTCEPRGFYQWAVENKYPIGTTHPLEQAHYDAAELMKDKFNELVKKSI